MSKRNRNGLLTLAAALVGGMSATALAQNRGLPRIVPEKHFTLAPNVHTPMVLKAEADAECSLHAVGDFDPSHAMKLYTNAEGYTRVYLTAKPESQDTHLQLDCITADAITVHPIHVHTASAPTDDMPAPEASIPTPQGAQVLPALTDEAARQLSDKEITSLGYPPRPDPTAAPGLYAEWLNLVSRPTTLLPVHPRNHTDISHQRPGIEAATAEASYNWSGFELRSSPFTYINVSANWSVPPVVIPEVGKQTYSSLWVGLDGDGVGGDTLAKRDLVQDGTESDASDFGGVFAANYYAWTELVPTQPTAQEQFSVNPGDAIFAHVWVGDSSGNQDLYGLNYWFFIEDITQQQAARFSMPYSNIDPFTGSEAEWIMERPTVGGGLPDLSGYVLAVVKNAWAYNVRTGKWNTSSTANRQITMNDKAGNVLSVAELMGSSGITFQWFNFH
jgi:hypothetical protein